MDKIQINTLEFFGILTKEKSYEEVITLMTTENRSYIREVIAKALFSAIVQEILNAVGSSYGIKLALCNGVNLAPIVISHNSCPVHLIVFAVELNYKACKLCAVTPVTDADFL